MKCLNLLPPDEPVVATSGTVPKRAWIALSLAAVALTATAAFGWHDLRQRGHVAQQHEDELASILLTATQRDDVDAKAREHVAEIEAFTDHPPLDRLLATITHAVADDSTLNRITITLPTPQSAKAGTSTRAKGKSKSAHHVRVELSGRSDNPTAAVGVMNRLGGYAALESIRLVSAQPEPTVSPTAQTFTVAFETPCDFDVAGVSLSQHIAEVTP